MLRKSKKRRIWLFAIALLGLAIPQTLKMPVQGATSRDYHPESFWYYPWGQSVTHKGVDIFAKEGVEIRSATYGFVLFAGKQDIGGNIVVVLGPKWRLHYYAHLKEIKTSTFSFANLQTSIGTVGSTGNAQGKPPHLHYTILTLIPYPWRIDTSVHGWKKMFFLNPIDYFKK